MSNKLKSSPIDIPRRIKRRHKKYHKQYHEKQYHDINHLSISPTYKNGDQIRKLFNDSIKFDKIASMSKKTYDNLLEQSKKLNNIESIADAPDSIIIENTQIALIIAHKNMLKTALDATIHKEKLTEARKLKIEPEYITPFSLKNGKLNSKKNIIAPIRA